MVIEGTCPRIYDISDIKNIDFSQIDQKFATDYELSQLRYLYYNVKKQILDFIIEKFGKASFTFRDAIENFDSYGENVSMELEKRIGHIRKLLYQKERFGKIPNTVAVDEDIYYHVTYPNVLKTGIDLSKGRMGKIRDIFSGNEYCISVTPGFVYLYKSSRNGLRDALDTAVSTGMIVVKVVVPKDLVVLDADQIRFVSNEMEFHDSENLRKLSWDEAKTYIYEHPEVKEKLERWPYRATPFRIDREQILEIIYNPNTITKYPEEELHFKIDDDILEII